MPRRKIKFILLAVVENRRLLANQWPVEASSGELAVGSGKWAVGLTSGKWAVGVTSAVASSAGRCIAEVD